MKFNLSLLLLLVLWGSDLYESTVKSTFVKIYFCFLPRFLLFNSYITFGYLTHFDLIFAYMMKCLISVFCTRLSSCHGTLAEKTLLSLLYCLGTLVKYQMTTDTWVYFCTLTYSHWSIYICLRQYHTVLIIIVLY